MTCTVKKQLALRFESEDMTLEQGHTIIVSYLSIRIFLL